MIEINRHSPEPMYLQVKRLLLDDIDAGRIRAREAIPNERELADDLGLSRMTVRRAILELADEGIVERIRGRGTFVRPQQRPARSVAAETFAVVAGQDQAEIRDSLFYHHILQGIQESTGALGAAVSFRKITQPHDAFVRSLDDDRSLSGVIVMGVVNQDLLRRIARMSLPAVLVDSAQADEGPALDQAGAISEEGAYQAARSLVQWGHRRIAILNYAPLTNAGRDREAGFTRALNEANLGPALAFHVPCSSEAAYATAKQLFQTGTDMTALFCTSDILAIGAMHAAAEYGIKIPRDLSITGFGDAGHFTTPPLSTVRMPMERMGKECVELLHARLNDPDAPVRIVKLPSEWMPRATCDSPRQAPTIGGQRERTGHE